MWRGDMARFKFCNSTTQRTQVARAVQILAQKKNCTISVRLKERSRLLKWFKLGSVRN
jgi:hypothetical protein